MAAKLGDNPNVWLGAALPDVGAMGRFNLRGDKPSGPIAEGIALHHATDDLFHGHEWFKAHQADLFSSLTAAGIRRGAAKAVAHVGPELLLDGELLSHTHLKNEIESGMGQLLPNLNEIETLVLPQKRQAWRVHLQRVAQRGAPTFYDDPFLVADSLERILRARPRLALDPAQVQTVGELLGEVHASIQQTSVTLVEDLADTLRSV